MNEHVKPAPLRHEAGPYFGQERRGESVPLDPTRILSRPPPSPKGRILFLRYIGIGILAGFVAEVAFPYAVKPSVVLGEAFARFHRQYMAAVNDKEIELKEQEKIAERRAEIEAERAKWVGLCMFAFDPQLVRRCQGFANGAFDAAESSIRDSKGK